MGGGMNVLRKCYTKDADLVTRDVAGETIIVPIKNKVGDLGSIYTLNEIGSTIWQLIDGKKSVNEIAKAVCNAYEVTPHVAEKDTLEFLNSLKEAGLLRLSDE
jgi:hypothetical protein